MRPQRGRAMASIVSRAIPWSAIVIGILSSAIGEAQTNVYQVIPLHPSGFMHSEALGISETQEVVGVGWNHDLDADGQALLWSGAGTRVTSLNPGATQSSVAWGASRGRVAGAVQPSGTPDAAQATLWTSYRATRISLTPPPGFAVSWAFDVSGEQTVGVGAGPATSSAAHALLWNGTATTAVDLNPGHLGFAFSHASGVHGSSGQQVGRGYQLIGVEGQRIVFGPSRALLWYGSAASAVDLHPSGFESSQATGVNGPFQLGWGVPAGDTASHALFWRGSAASVIDLHPTGFTETFGIKPWAGRQVGFGYGPATSDNRHALLWRGSAASVVDLHTFLPDGFVESAAYGVDQYGNVAGSAVTAQGAIQAMLWQRLPDLVGLAFPNGSTVQGNRFVRLYVGLDGPAAAGDAIVELASSNPAVAAVPSSGVTIVPSGSSSVIDGLRVNTVATLMRVTITATHRGASRSAVLTVIPASLSALKFQPEQITICQSASGLVILDGPAPSAGAVVSITGSSPGASLLASWPSRVTVPAGADRTSFTLTPTRKGTGTVSLSASYAGRTRQNSVAIVSSTTGCSK